MHEGYPHKQAIAIAFSKAGRSKDEVAPGPRPQPDLLGDLPGQGPSQTPAPVERRAPAPSYATGDAASKLRAWNEANRAFYSRRR